MYIIYSKSIKEAFEVCLGKALSQSHRLLTRLPTPNFRLLIINLMIQVHDNYDIQIITNVEVT